MLKTGLGLRSQHYQDFVNSDPDIGFIEIHAENYFGGGEHLEYLRKISSRYPLSIHAVGLSLGSADGISKEHVKKLKKLVDEFEPFIVSDHISWSKSGNAHLGDLLPLPYNEEVLLRITDNINLVQDELGRNIIVENPSTYLEFKNSTMPEYEFMNLVSEKSGCGILLDINNIFVQSVNHNFSAIEYLNSVNTDKIGEIHLAGHIEYQTSDGGLLLIDTHSKEVCDEVWNLYKGFISRNSNIPVLIEWIRIYQS